MNEDCRVYLITPPLAFADLERFAPLFAKVVEVSAAASALARLAPGAEGDAKRILAPLIEIAAREDVALIVENDLRLAARAGADGAHVAPSGLEEALESLHPQRIVGVGLLRLREEAMTAAEAGADYVMFGEPRKDGYLPPFAETFERSAWWAEIFETPCVAYAATLHEAEELASAGVDFVALGDGLWRAPDPAAAAAEAKTRIAAAALRRTRD
jgi:thiamine-phosphate pyrophosphorylase